MGHNSMSSIIWNENSLFPTRVVFVKDAVLETREANVKGARMTEGQRLCKTEFPVQSSHKLR